MKSVLRTGVFGEDVISLHEESPISWPQNRPPSRVLEENVTTSSCRDFWVGYGVLTTHLYL